MTINHLKRRHPTEGEFTGSQLNQDDATPRSVRQKIAQREDERTHVLPLSTHENGQRLGNQDSSSDVSSDSESDISSSDSASESDDASSDEDETPADADSHTVISVAPQRRKPSFKANANSSAKALRSRLDAFLPQLRDANSHLQNLKRQGKVSSMDVVSVDERSPKDKAVVLPDVDQATDAEEDDETSQEAPYVEMDLGLGVLEEKPEVSALAARRHDGHQDDDSGGGPVKPPEHGEGVLERLMGRTAQVQAPKIEEV